MNAKYILTIIVLSALSLRAGTNTTLTLSEALQHGLKYSPAARTAELEVDIAQTQIGQAGALALPQLSLQGNYTRIDEVPEINFGGDAFELGSADNYEVSAQISQLVYSGGQVGAAWRAARISREFAMVNRAAFEAFLTHEITRLFYATLLAREAVNVQQASLDMLQQFEKQAQDRKDGGAASEFDALTARVRVANARPALIAAQNQMDLAKASLANLIHFEGAFDIDGSLAVEPITRTLPELEMMALQQREHLQAAKLLADLSREAVSHARSGARPEIRLFANQTGGNASQFDLSDDWEWRWSAGITARWNLWDGNLTRQTIRQREIERQQQEYNIQETESAVLLEVKQAWLALQQAEESLAASTESITLAQRALQIAQTRYNSGLSTYLELTDANLALRTAELTRLQAKHDHAVARTRLRFAVGLPSPYCNNQPPPEANGKETL